VIAEILAVRSRRRAALAAAEERGS
jgi:hypothetical protein